MAALILLLGLFSFATAEIAFAQEPAASSDVGELEQIIVTAQRRSQSLADVPASVTVKTGEDLQRAGIVTVTELTQVIPGLKIDQGGSQTVPTLRGISSLGTSIGNDPSVATYIDGVYQPSQSANTFDLPDIERIEVLKGPQGTLYGRNATGGVILITTRDPTFTPSGDALVSFGTDGDFDATMMKGFVSGPLASDRLAAALSVLYIDQDGYNRDLLRGGYIGGKESVGVRGKLLFTPSDRVRVLLTGYYSDSEDGTGVAGNALNGNSVGNAAGFLTPSQPWETALDIIPTINVEKYGANVKVNVDLGFADLMSFSAANWNRVLTIVPSDYSAFPGPNYIGPKPDDMLMQDFVLTSTADGPIEWLIGASYYKDEAGYLPLSVATPGSPPTTLWVALNAEAYALFSEVTYSLTSRLRLTGGLRYSHERKAVFGIAGSNLPEPDSIPKTGSESWDDVTPRISALYELTDDINVYATYSEGFKSGTYNATGIGSAPVDPETVSAYEVGIKSSVLGRVDASLSLFSYDYENIQVTTNVAGIGRLQNAASANIEGLELEATLRATDEFNLRAGLSILDARYADFPDAITLVPQFLNGLPNGNANITTDLSGYRLVRSPKWTLSLSADYLKELNSGTLDLAVNAYHSDEYFYDSLNRVMQPAYTLLGARLGWTLPESNLRFGIWGKNLTNEAVFNSVYINARADGVAYAMPRQYGAQVSYSF